MLYHCLLLFGMMAFASANEEEKPAEAPAAHLTPEVCSKVLEKFGKSPKNRKKRILKEIHERIEENEDPALQEFLGLVARLKEELDPDPQPKPEYYDPKIYARGLVKRKYVKTKRKKDREKLEAMKRLFRVEECAPPFFARYVYDFGKNEVFDTREDPSTSQEIEDFLNGYPPGKDIVAARLMRQWDFDASRDLAADFFNHVYCDLDARAYPGIRIYHAMASQITMDMPDVDVIAYARLIEGDASYVSPIPADERRTELYERIKVGFLDFFQYHTWIESAAWIYVNPDAAIRPELEPLRDRLIYNFALEEGDVEKIAKRLATAGDRDGFIEQTDKIVVATAESKNKSLRATFRESKSAPLRAVKRIALDVLDKYDLIPEDK